MDVNGFRQFLQKRQLAESAVAQHIALAERFERFVPTPPTAADARAFISALAAENAATFDNLVALASYGRFVKSDAVYLTVLERVALMSAFR
jgi:hypothetical protein